MLKLPMGPLDELGPTGASFEDRRRSSTTRPKFFPDWTLERECRSTLT